MKRDKFDNFAIFLGILVFGYTCLRANFVSISHDEALTYLIHAQGSFREIFGHLGPVNSNNHLLNTILIKLFTASLGNSEFVIRIPALIGHALYLIASYNILKLFLQGKKFVIGFVLMIISPFLLDFFSCARGYSLGLGFTILGLYYAMHRLDLTDPHVCIKNNALAVSMLVMAVLSNIAFLNIVVPILSMLIILEIKGGFRQFCLRILPVSIFGAFFLLLIYNPPVIQRITSYVSYYGGVKGFWADTVGSLLECSLYGKNYSSPETILIAKIFIFMFFFISVITLLILFLKKQEFNPLNRYLFWISAIIFITSLGMAMQFPLLHIKYAIDRMAIYLIPIYLILPLLLWEHIYLLKHQLSKVIINSFFYALAFIILFHCISCFNISYFYFWKYDASTKKAMKIIYDLTTSEECFGRRFRIGINWLFEPSTNYYILRKGMDWVERVDRSGPDGKYDYYYLLEEDQDVIGKYDLRIVKSFSLSSSYLALPK